MEFNDDIKHKHKKKKKKVPFQSCTSMKSESSSSSSPSCSCSSRAILSILATIILLYQPNCLAKRHQPPCPPSSCGKIHNISHPFRLTTDPPHCGDQRYQFDCENNNTTLSLTFSFGKFHVHNIDYNRIKLRLTDASAAENDTATTATAAANCSSSYNIPRYFLYDRSFIERSVTELVGPDDFGSDPFILDSSFDRIAYFNCSDRIEDSRYVSVDNSRCGTGRGYVYAVMEPSLYEYRVRDIKVGCTLVAATLGSRSLQGIGNGNGNGSVSYGEIHGVIMEGFEVSWLPVVCEDRCGKRTKCEVVDEFSGEVQCDRHYCHYAYKTTDKCAYLRGIVIGFRSRITFSTKQLDNPVGLEYFDGGIYIGRTVLPSLLAARYALGVTIVLVIFIYRWRRRHLSVYENIENFLLDTNLNPLRYEYKEIKKMTGGFRVKLGQGGFGSVYKGKLRSGPDVAVKMLSKSDGDGQDFINEVATIGRIHHVNVVRLVGYCVEGKKRALIYEFMPNGSLDKYIFSKEGSDHLSYDKIYEISLGIARGISYLHQGCDMQILHFDIKPHNILLDDNFIPKVSDFGLAKLYSANDSIVPLTAARGTLGYMAPELFYKNIGGVSYKADVYSFGMLLMEMTSRRKNSNPHAEHSSQVYFPFWVYDQFKEVKDIEFEDASEEEMILAKRMFMVSLWCIQFKPSDRPSMNKVVEMLEGKAETLEMPPRPTFYPNQTVKPDDGNGINSDQTSWSDSTWSDSYNLGESFTGE